MPRIHEEKVNHKNEVKTYINVLIINIVPNVYSELERLYL